VVVLTILVVSWIGLNCVSLADMSIGAQI
jgi:hypothetical protein